MAEKEYVPPAQRSGGTGRAKRVPVAELQEKVLAYIGEGLTVKDAMAKVDRTVDTYDQWRSRTPEFANRVDKLRARLKAGPGDRKDPGDFGEWRLKYLKMETFPHQWQWVDLLEGREPRELHPSETYIKGRRQRIIINTPPFHAKSTTITMDYVVWRICKDPNVRVIIISESSGMAEKMLEGIKARLTSPRFQELQDDFAPPGGFKGHIWSRSMIYVAGRDTLEKDPTVESLGIGSQIYGARADLIIMDDTVTLKTARTAGQREKLLELIDQEASSRLEPETGRLLVVGTRVNANDVYSSLLKRDQDKPADRRVWTYLGQPAVLEYADEDEDWHTLWPFLWDGKALSLRRDEIPSGTWNLVYMQQQVSEDAVFPEEAVMKCRYMGNTGPLPDSVRPGGMNGLYIVAGLDPAGAGYTAIVVLGVDKRTGVRYVLDVINHRGCTPLQLQQHVARVQERFRPNEWRIEKNGVQTHISQNPEIRRIIQMHGSKIVEHSTYGNKWDADFGVTSLAPLFLGALSVPSQALIAIPDNGTHKGIKAMIDQLVTWEPEGTGKTDIVMALWFADLGCRKVLEGDRTQKRLDNKWATRGQLAKTRSINFEEALSAQMGGFY